MTILQGVVTKTGVMGKTVTVTVSIASIIRTLYWTLMKMYVLNIGIEKGYPPYPAEGDETTQEVPGARRARA
jgi:hypothetical protein